MIEHLCKLEACGGFNRKTLFDNSMVKDYPQWHGIKTDEKLDDIIIETGMVTSRNQLRRLYHQGAIKWDGWMLAIGQRRLIIQRTEINKEQAIISLPEAKQ